MVTVDELESDEGLTPSVAQARSSRGSPSMSVVEFVRALSGRERIEDSDVVVKDEALREMVFDETRPTRDQHRLVSNVGSLRGFWPV